MAVAAQSNPASYGPRPRLPRPDTTHSVARFPRVVGWPEGRTPSAPRGFEVSLFAAGFHSPRSLRVLPNGDLLVVESANPGTPRDWSAPPPALAARFASRNRTVSANRITILRDTTGDGLPDVRVILVEGLNRPFGVAALGEHLYVANTDALVRFPYRAGQMAITGPAEKVLDLPAGGYNNHWTRNLLVGRGRDSARLFVSVGSATNVDTEGIDARDPRRAAILEVDPVAREGRVYASGLRNPVGMDWLPGTNVLWTAVNERDGLGDDLPPDYVTSVREGAFYGWPYAYFGPNEDPRQRGRRPDLVERTLAPDFATGAHTATLNLLFGAPTSFPVRYRDGLFIAQHGSWNRAGFDGYRIGFLPFAKGAPAGPLEPFLTGFVGPEPGTAFGRPIGLAVWRDGSLLVSDDASNVIWRVQWRSGAPAAPPAAPAAPVHMLPRAIKWTANPAIPAGGELAVLLGSPGKAGPYVSRVRFPADFRVMPHSHPEDRIYTVISGTWHIGLGDRFDPAALGAFPAGSVYSLSAGTSHFHWARSGQSIVQVNAVGPTAIDYVNPADDPRKR